MSTAPTEMPQPLSIQELVLETNKLARRKGWWDDPSINIGEKLALIHSEISEALEEAREFGLEKDMAIYFNESNPDKPEGLAVELADAIIRITDLCGQFDLPLEAALRLKHEYNKSRPYRHGKVF